MLPSPRRVDTNEDRGKGRPRLGSSGRVIGKLFEFAATLAYAVADGLGHAGAELRRRFSAVVVVPDLGKFADIKASLDGKSFATLVEGLLTCQKVSLCLPQFNIDMRASLKTMLVSLGMTSAFSLEAADFSDPESGPLAPPLQPSRKANPPRTQVRFQSRVMSPSSVIHTPHNQTGFDSLGCGEDNKPALRGKGHPPCAISGPGHPVQSEGQRVQAA
jgi:hypothetical protein